MHGPLVSAFALLIAHDGNASVVEKDVEFLDFSLDTGGKLETRIVVIEVELKDLDDSIRIGLGNPGIPP